MGREGKGREEVRTVPVPEDALAKDVGGDVACVGVRLAVDRGEVVLVRRILGWDA